MVRASSSLRVSKESAMRSSRRPRSRGPVLLQVGKAFAAAATAASTSAALPRGTSPIGERLAGFSTLRTAPETLSTQAPSISIRAWRFSVAVS